MNEREVFTAARQLSDPAERAAFLDRACAGDQELRRRIVALLEEQAQLGSFLEHGHPPAGTLDQPITEAPGAVIGSYKLMEQIGEGGFGLVFVAEQHEPVRREVALKILKPGMDTRQVIGRFEAERQALAIMDHPNIAKVFDGGATPSGRPYFVMELVKGTPITQFCDENRSTPRQRLELFVDVCAAVQHAHQKGIIHRDLKPSNVLVTSHDGKPVVKVIDFGVAKAIGGQLTDKTVYTQLAQLIGTPLYMSPEQAGQSGLDIDTRSDIYSLGVLLYELLTGTTPFTKERFKQAAYDEIRRIIREEEPPRPSTRLSDSHDSLPSISAQRQTEPAKLTRLVRGELDWIVMKTLEKDRNRRYETAKDFAADVQRYLDDEPVQACPPSVGYRLRKFVRRNKRALLTAGLVALAMLIAVGALGWSVRDRNARHKEAAMEATARQEKLEIEVNGALKEAESAYKRDALPEAAAAVTQAERLVSSGGGSEELKQRVQRWRTDINLVIRYDRLRAQGLRMERNRDEETDQSFLALFREYGIDVESLSTVDAAARIRESAVKDRLVTAMDHWIMLRKGDMKLAQTSWQPLLDIARAADPDVDRNLLREALVTRDYATVRRLTHRDRLPKLPIRTVLYAMDVLRSRGSIEEGRAFLRQVHLLHPDDYWVNMYAAILAERAKPPQWSESIRYSSAALAREPRNALCWTILGTGLANSERGDEAIAAFRRAIEFDPSYAAAHCNLGVSLSKVKKWDEAIVAYRKAIDLNPKYADAYNNLGAALAGQQRLDEAIAACRKAIELDPKYASAHHNLGNVLQAQRKLDEAIFAYRKAIELDPKYALTYSNLGRALAEQQKLDEAIIAVRKAIELDPKNYWDYVNLGSVLLAQRKLDESVVAYRKALELDPNFATAWINLGNALCAQQKFDEGVVVYRKAIELAPHLARAHHNLGNALFRQSKLDEAILAFRRAIELDPKHATAYSGLGYALRRQQKPDEAIVAFREAIALDPKYAAAHKGLALALWGKRDREGAAAAFTEAVHLQPNDADAHNGLAMLMALSPDKKFRDLKKAVELAEKAIELQPKDAKHWGTLGLARYEGGDWKGAIAAAEQSMKLRPLDDSARNYNADLTRTFNLFVLAMAHWRLDDKQQARKWYDQAIEWLEKTKLNDPDLPRLRRQAEELLGVNK